ncbi:hypothetical protein ACO1C4_21925 [Bacillus cereus]|uniref:hypothetical protein n=1 Tax=Bacillus cereus TaxID=1396 RepID=UPI003BF7649E
MFTEKRLPFEVGKQDNFYDKLNEWIGDVFYDILPDEAAHEKRESVSREMRKHDVVGLLLGLNTQLAYN